MIILSKLRNLTTIYQRAFSESGLEEVKCCNTTLIKMMAGTFNECSKLVNVDFSGCTSLQLLDGSNFYNCKSLERVKMRDCYALKSISWSTFYGCSKLVEAGYSDDIVDFSNNTNLTFIGANSFQRCSSVTKIDFSNTKITSFGDDGQYGICSDCSSLVEVDLSGCDALKLLARQAFYNCKVLERVKMSGCTALTSLGSWGTFYNCYKLVEAGYSDNIVDFSNSNITSIPNGCFYQCKSITKMDFSNSKITKFGNESDGDGVCNTCTSLTEVDLSDCTELTTLGGRPFINCTGLVRVKMRNCNALTSIVGWGTFMNCTSLIEVGYSDNIVDFSNSNITSIPKACFYQCKSITKMDFSNTKLTKFGDTGDEYGTCHTCTSLTEVDLSDCTDLSVIGTRAFISCSNLVKVKTRNSKSITKIGWAAFGYCKKLVEAGYSDDIVDFSNNPNLVWIDNAVFYQCQSVTKIDFSNTKITKWGGTSGEPICQSCSSLLEVDLSGCDELIQLGFKAFADCSKLVKVNMQGCLNLQSIGGWCFGYCKALTDAGYSSGVVDFSNNANLTSVGGGCFNNCHSVTKIDFSNTKITTFGGGYNEGICENCKELADVDFTGCDVLVSIGARSFNACKKLVTFTAPDSPLTAVGERAFEYCLSMKDFNIKLGNNCALATHCFVGWRNPAGGTPSTDEINFKMLGPVPTCASNYITTGWQDAPKVNLTFAAAYEADYKTDGKWLNADGSWNHAWYSITADKAGTITFV